MRKVKHNNYPATRKSTSKFWTPEKLDEARGLASQGKTLRETAALLGVHFANLSYQARRNGIKFKGSQYGRRKDPTNRFFQARWKAGYSVWEASEKIGIEVSTLQKWERGEHLPKDLFLRDCAAEVYGCDPQELVTDKEIMERNHARSKNAIAARWAKREA